LGAQLKIIRYQAVVIVLSVVVTGILNVGWLDYKALLYGGSISLTVSLVMLLRVNQATKKVSEGNQSGNLYIYIGAIERLFVSIALFGLGFVWLKLMPFPMIVGLIVGQIGFSVGGYKAKD
jgi:hypothetical protein